MIRLVTPLLIAAPYELYVSAATHMPCVRQMDCLAIGADEVDAFAPGGVTGDMGGIGTEAADAFSPGSAIADVLWEWPSDVATCGGLVLDVVTDGETDLAAHGGFLGDVAGAVAADAETSSGQQADAGVPGPTKQDTGC